MDRIRDRNANEWTSASDRAMQSRKPVPQDLTKRFQQTMDAAGAATKTAVRQENQHQQQRTEGARKDQQLSAESATPPAGIVSAVAARSRSSQQPSQDSEQSTTKHTTDSQSFEFAALLQGHSVIDVGDAAPPPPANDVDDLASLIERHVRQLLISDGGLENSDGQVMLRFAEDSLGGADVMLSRLADGGWHLQATSDDPATIDAIAQFAPALQARFEDHQLGSLSIVTGLNDND